MEIPPPPAETIPPMSFPVHAEPQKPSRVKKVLRFIFWFTLAASIFLNVYLTALIAASMTSSVSKTVIKSGKSGHIIAIYNVDGVIDAKAAEQFYAFKREVIDDANIRAIVLRVDSPGGGVAASDQIAEGLRQLKKAGKKIIVSMGGVAASGGYYISAGADEIFAEPTTITGSIGVIMSWVVLKDGLNKLGIEPIVMKSKNAYNWKDEISVFKEPDIRQKEHLQQVLDNMQARFEQIVKDGRGAKLKPAPAKATTAMAVNMPNADLSSETEPLNGKIYFAQDALQFGLIDQIGYQAQAVEKARELAGIDDPTIVQYSKRIGLMEKLFNGQTSAILNTEVIDELRTPKIEMRWMGQ